MQERLNQYRPILAVLIAVKWWCFMVWIKTEPTA